MRVVPQRSPALQCVALLGGVLVGPLASLLLAVRWAPGSELVQTLSVLAFVAVFAGGILVWLGLGIAAVALRFLLAVVPGLARASEPPRAEERLVPPGYQAFVVLGAGAGMVVGLSAGVGTALPVPLATTTWSLLGLGYGLLLWAAAHHGYLPFEPE